MKKIKALIITKTEVKKGLLFDSKEELEQYLKSNDLIGSDKVVVITKEVEVEEVVQ